MAGGTVTATWSGSNSRTPTAYAADAPPMSPLAVPVANAAGQWLFAVVSWRQDAGTAGVLQYPSTVNISDDAHNFWIPLQPGLHASGIVRCAVWMAPAARAAEYVFVVPDLDIGGERLPVSAGRADPRGDRGLPVVRDHVDRVGLHQPGHVGDAVGVPGSGLFTIAVIAC